MGVDLHITPTVTVNLDVKGTHARRDVEKRQSHLSLDQSWTFGHQKRGLFGAQRKASATLLISVQ